MAPLFVLPFFFLLRGPSGKALARCGILRPRPVGPGEYPPLLDYLGVVVVAGGLRQKKNVFVASSRPIRYGFWHAVFLVPDNIRSQVPSIRPQGKGYHPGNAYKVFGFEP